MIPADVAKAKALLGGIDALSMPIEAHGRLFETVAKLDEHPSDDYRSIVKACEWLASWVQPGGSVWRVLRDTVRALGYLSLAALWDGKAATGKASLDFRDGRVYLLGPRNKGGQSALRYAMAHDCHNTYALKFHSMSKEWSVPAEYAAAFVFVARTHWLGITSENADSVLALAKAYTETQEKPIAIETPATENAAETPAPVETPKVETPKVTIKQNGATIEIFSPYNGAFVAAIKALPWKDRQWNGVSKCWVVKAEHMGKAKEIVSSCYQCDPLVV